MSDYLQPDFYRFNQDSLSLVNWIAQKKIRPIRVLDLGAGSGVIGIELANRLAPEELHLLEVQKEYEPYLRHNLETQKKGHYLASFELTSFGEWKPQKKYDLIVSNPPYYLPGSGEASKDHRKGIARSFQIDNWSILFELIKTTLASDGVAYLVVKSDKTLLEHVRKESQEKLSLKEHSLGELTILELR